MSTPLQGTAWTEHNASSRVVDGIVTYDDFAVSRDKELDYEILLLCFITSWVQINWVAIRSSTVFFNDSESFNLEYLSRLVIYFLNVVQRFQHVV